MKHRNIAIFVPHAGCPHACSFCNQKTITAQSELPRAADVQRICTQAFSEISDRRSTEVAFFGGSFTAIDRSYMTELLESVQPFLATDGFSGIRISTRPDGIDGEILTLLKGYGVTAIELGAQSMCDHVLTANHRGHTAQDVETACRLIREAGFELGLQMMVGLYGSSAEDEHSTLERILELHPDTVRIYPVAVLKGTVLAGLYESGSYRLFSMDEVVEFCADALWDFHQSGISVIKCGLHASEFVEQDLIAGFYHPAFRELCEGRVYRNLIASEIERRSERAAVIAVHPSEISKAAGHKRENLMHFRERGIALKIMGDASLKKYQCRIRSNECT